MLLAHLHESDFDNDLPLLARIILRRMKTDEVKIWAKLSNGSKRVFGDITNIRMGTPLPLGNVVGNGLPIPRLFITWKHMTRPGGKTEWVRADSFDDRYDFSKDEDGHWVLTDRLRQVDEEVDVELLEPILRKLLDKDRNIRLYWRIDERDTFEWQGTIVDIGRRPENAGTGFEIQLMVISPGTHIPQEYGYKISDLETYAEFTKINGEMALAITGNMS